MHRTGERKIRVGGEMCYSFNLYFYNIKTQGVPYLIEEERHFICNSTTVL